MENTILFKNSNKVFIIVIIIINIFLSNKVIAQNLNFNWTAKGLGGGGTMYSPAVSPHNSDLMFISCDMSGVYRSSDAGKSWTMLNYHQIIGSTTCPPVFHPTDANIIWDDGSASELMQSTDAGITWNDTKSILAGIAAMLCMRTEPLCLVIATWSGIIKSNDGTNFTTVFSSDTPTLLAENGSLIIAATNLKLWISSDRGNTFNTCSIPSTISSSNQIMDIAINNSAIFISSQKQLWKSTNNGTSWTAKLYSDTLKRGDFNFVRTENNIVWLTPSENNATYQPTALLSTDNGETFKETFFCNTNSGDVPNLVPEWISLEYNCWWGGAATGLNISRQNPGLVLWTDMGRSLMTTDTGKTWTANYTNFADALPRAAGKKWNSTGLDITTNWDIFMSPTNPNHYHVAYTDINGSISEDGGELWRSTSNTGIPSNWYNTTYKFAFDSENNKLWGAFSWKHDIILGWSASYWSTNGNHGGVCYSTNEGLNWTPVQTGGLPDKPVTSIAIDWTSSASARRIYVAVWTDGIWKSENGGTTWTRCSTGLATGDGTCTTNGPNTHVTEVQVYQNGDVFAMKSMYLRNVTTNKMGAKNDGGLWKSTDHGNSWNFISSNVADCDPNSIIDANNEHSWADPISFLIDENNENHIYVCAQNCNYGKVQGGLYETSNGGTSWTRILTIYGAVRLTKSKYFANRYYLATDGNGFMYSNDNMATWIEDSLFPFNLTERVTEDINDSNVIWVNTFGGGLWKGVIKNGTTGVNDNINNAEFINIYPNPFHSALNINTNYEQIEIYNYRGELVETLNNNAKQWIPDNSISSGVYEIVIKSNNEFKVYKVVYLK